METINNFIDLFIKHYESKPNSNLLIFYPENKEKVYTIKQFYNLVHSYNEQFDRLGVVKGDRILMLLLPSVEFYAASLALIGLGAAPVFVQPKYLNKTIKIANPKFIFTQSKYLKYQWIVPAMRSREVILSDRESRKFRSVKSSYKATKELIVRKMSKEDPLIISYTTGTTGNIKAANRNYEISYNQFFTSANYWKYNNNSVDITFFPVVVFQNILSGITTLVPDIFGKKLSQINFTGIVEAMIKYQVSRISSAPGYLDKLCDHAMNKISSIRQLITGGAPVPPDLAIKIMNQFKEADSHIVYGSTEAEPISFVEMSEYVKCQNYSFNVGQPISEINMKFVNDDNNFVSKGKVGEIVISGNHVVKNYLNNELANKKFKLHDKLGQIWHKTGDMGYMDSNGCVHILGRKKFKIINSNIEKYNLELETELRQRLHINERVAVKKVGTKICVYIETKKLNPALVKKIKKYMFESYNKACAVKKVKSFPVDTRHHWKVNYSSL